MLRFANLPFPLDYTEQDYIPYLASRFHIPEREWLQATLSRKSVDARDKSCVHFVLTLDAVVRNENAVLKRLKPGTASRIQEKKACVFPQARFELRPVVVGAGPAGLFAALVLSRQGARPILLERGKPVDQRTEDVNALMRHGRLDPESNVQFGEGGAGAFSDGKLTTGIKSPWQHYVLETLVQHGAPEEILYLQKPHIGTDRLKNVVASIRREILSLGGDVRFETRMDRLLLHGSRLAGIHTLSNGCAEEIITDTVLLCIGHSARDTVQTLFQQGVRMIQKPFAAGVRIEHPQSLINHAQYGNYAGHPALRAAEYKLSVQTPDKRGVYTFCMCPGGEVIAAASQPGGIAVNGMSHYARDGVNANAALLVGIRTEDFGDDHPLAGFVYQRTLEQAAYRAGGGSYRAPVQRVEDFLRRRASAQMGSVTPSYRPGVTPADLHTVLPPVVCDNLMYALPRLDGMLRGMAMPDAVLTGVETRSSSPVRMLRGTDGMAEGIDGLFPVGEGAGFAGGIVSAAVDGIHAACMAMERSSLL